MPLLLNVPDKAGFCNASFLKIAPKVNLRIKTFLDDEDKQLKFYFACDFINQLARFKTQALCEIEIDGPFNIKFLNLAIKYY